MTECETKTSLDELQMDALREIGSMGTAHAASALSKMLDDDIMAEVTNTMLIRVEELPTAMGDPTTQVFGIYMGLMGEHEKSRTMMVLPVEGGRQLLRNLLPGDGEPDEPPGEMERSVMCEVGNICIGAYLNAIATFVDLTLIPSTPAMACDMLGAVMEFPAAMISMHSSHAVVIDTRFAHGDKMVSGSIFLLPDEDLQSLIFKNLGLEDLVKDNG